MRHILNFYSVPLTVFLGYMRSSAVTVSLLPGNAATNTQLQIRRGHVAGRWPVEASRLCSDTTGVLQGRLSENFSRLPSLGHKGAFSPKQACSFQPSLPSLPWENQTLWALSTALQHPGHWSHRIPCRGRRLERKGGAEFTKLLGPGAFQAGTLM